MGSVIDLKDFLADEPDPETMDREELRNYLHQLEDRIERLDQQEPEDMDSEEYERWGEKHEELEDLVDDVLDLLDNMK